ncbi:MAG TPA: hypothetical protein VKT78_14025 [Fimbriimonadaceae bacterium]|nr:hypothetical protein [Fimbriimonadaceae bacterium]
MRLRIHRLLGATAVACAMAAPSVGNAQIVGHQGPPFWGFGYQCIDPLNTTPFSNPYFMQFWGNELVCAALGLVGTVTFGAARNATTDPNPPCFVPAVTANAPGRISFGAGSIGSVQSSFDDSMAFSFAYPLTGADWGYATITTDSKTLNGQPASTRTLFGASGFRSSFVGASDRYFFAEEIAGSTTIDLRIDEIAEVDRLDWKLTNTDAAASHTLGLWVGCWMAMASPQTGQTSGISLLQDFPLGYNNFKDGYVVVPGQIPPTVEHRYIRAQDSANFPAFVDFCFGQESAYGMRVENGPTPDTEDAQGLNSDCTSVDEFALGQAFFLLGSPNNGGDSTFPDQMFGAGNTGGDVTYIDNPGYIQKYYEQNVPSGGSREIIQYYRSTWAASNYSKPYSVVLDAPPLMAPDLTTATGLATPAGGYTIRVYVDNTRGFATADKTIEMDNVNITIKLPPGLNLANGDTATKVIPKIGPAPQQDPGQVLPGQPLPIPMSFVEFHVIPDGIANGILPYSVTVSPTPGPVKTVTGTITVSATPKLTLIQGPNLVGAPWNFTDSAWESILGLVNGTDFEAYAWDPVQNGYVVSPSNTRGTGVWIVANSAIGIRALQGNPSVPSDIASGSNLIKLQAGWNIISNPYPYPVPVAQLIGASNANPNQDFTWTEMVAQGFVNGAVGYYNTATGSYSYLQNGTDLLLPNVGYWVFVGVPQPLSLKYPPVFQEFLPGSQRSTAPTAWTQSDSQWRLQLTVHTGKSVDDQNWVGFAKSATDVTKYQIMKPPALPAKVAAVNLAIQGTVNGKATRMAQALTTAGAHKEFTFTVTTPQAGETTVTWPNISTIPKTVQARLVDTATGQSRIMNQVSGYTFTANAGATRTFKVQFSGQTPGRATIGNVFVTKTGRAVNSPLSIHYTLGVAATTSIQITNAAGTPIYTVISGRADTVGENTVVWNLRDNANRQVAPGKYNLLIRASTPDGNTATRNVPVNVIR